jgi:DNA-directed RNA polymerase II subunit RPB1
VNYWLFHNGFSIGISDTVVDWKTMEYITEQIKTRKQNIKDVTLQASQDLLKPSPDTTVHASFKGMVDCELNLARETSRAPRLFSTSTGN